MALVQPVDVLDDDDGYAVRQLRPQYKWWAKIILYDEPRRATTPGVYIVWMQMWRVRLPRRSDYQLLVARVSDGPGRVEQPCNMQIPKVRAREVPIPGNIDSNERFVPKRRGRVEHPLQRGMADPHDLWSTSAGTPGSGPTSGAAMSAL